MNLSCRDVVRTTAEILGGEGTPELSNAIGRHIGACPACAEKHDELEDLLHRARQVEVPEPSDAYWSDFMPELRRRLEPSASPVSRFAGTPRFALRDWLWPSLATASLLFLLAVSLRPQGLSTSIAVASIDEEEELYEFAEAIDLLTPFDPLDGWDIDIPLEEATDVATGDLFAFLESAVDLEPDETEALLGDLGDQFAG